MNTPIPNHPLTGTVVTYRPDHDDARHLDPTCYVVRNWDECIVKAVFFHWNGVPNLTMFYVYVPATGMFTHVSERECGTFDLLAHRSAVPELEVES